MDDLAFQQAAPDEARRLERLRSYAVLDTPREPAFDRLVFTAAQLFRAPIAVLCLADANRYWFKAAVGIGFAEVGRETALCKGLSATDGVLVVDDARSDQRFSESPLVHGEPYVRFFASAPLVTPDGLLLGSLCVMDRVPKTLLARQPWQLALLAQGAVAALEARMLGQAAATTRRTASP